MQRQVSIAEDELEHRSSIKKQQRPDLSQIDDEGGSLENSDLLNHLNIDDAEVQYEI